MQITLYQIIKMKKIQLVVCDMAGTTVRDESEVENCFSQACSQTGLDIPAERIKAVQGWSKRYVFEVLWTEKLGKDHPGLDDKIETSYILFTQILEKHYIENPILPTDGALDFFKFCKENNIKVALTTGFYRKVTDIILQKLGWLEGLDGSYISNGSSVIDCSVASDEVEAGRPAPDMIFLAMKKLNITDPGSVISVGDTPSDLQCGRNAQIRATYGLTNGTHERRLLAPYDNDGLLPNINALSIEIRQFNTLSHAL
jgi:phosphonatase-like hydrolase